MMVSIQDSLEGPHVTNLEVFDHQESRDDAYDQHDAYESGDPHSDHEYNHQWGDFLQRLLLGQLSPVSSTCQPISVSSTSISAATVILMV